MSETQKQADERILGKIKKCLALSQSPNEHEAAAALRQAQKLMAEYNVSIEGLAQAEVKEEKAKSVAWRKAPQWEVDLANMCGQAFGCKLLIHLGYEGKLAEFAYIGLSHNAQLASYAHTVIQRQVVKAREAYLRGRTDLSGRGEKMAAGETFCRAYISVMRSKVVALSLQPEQEKAIADKMAALYPVLGKGKPAPQRGFDRDAYGAGQSAGANQSLHRPMNGKEQLKLTA